MDKDLEKLKSCIQSHYKQCTKTQRSSLLSLSYPSGHSNTTRSKSYKKGSEVIHCGPLNQIVEINTLEKRVTAEPRVTMRQLVKALKPYDLMPRIIPEFKGITVGGAIMGAAAESSSFRHGIFHDQCHSLEIIRGDGSSILVSRNQNEDLFWGVSGSYGSIGTLGKIQLKLTEILDSVLLEYHFFHDLKEAIAFLKVKTDDLSLDFLDGIIFSPTQAAIILGKMCNRVEMPALPVFSQKNPGAEWYYQHVQNLMKKTVVYKELMEVEEYYFRFDLSAFWMGAYLYNFTFLQQFICEGLLKKGSKKSGFSQREISKIYNLKSPNLLMRALGRIALNSQVLWKLHHKADKWIQDRFVVQDFCIPSKQAESFLSEMTTDPAIYPIWLCPIKGSHQSQIFAPHLIKNTDDNYFINFGLYGLPSKALSTRQITRQLEDKTARCGGRKVLYSRSYYSEKQFWEIYSHCEYKKLRKKTLAQGIWHEITQKVLTE